MFVDVTVLLGDCEEKLERLIQEFGRVVLKEKVIGELD